MIKTTFLPCLLTAILVFSPAAYGQGIPVYDASSFSQMVTQLEAMSKDYQKQLEQLNEAVKQTNALTGPRNMGSLNNSPLEAELRRYLPNTWQQTLNMMNAQGLGNSAINTRNIYSILEAAYKPLPGAEFIPSDPEGPTAKALDNRNRTTYAAMAASEQAYNNIAGRLETYESLMEKLNNTTDLKESVDLQARIAAETGIAMTEILRLQAIQMQQQAATDNETLTTYRRASTANKYDPVKAAESFKPKE
ncbi:MAG: hypothetical protein DI551_07275 [Micavibrio aeruginosavorus]|uniref:P-type DNA transfer protein VirB5 n=1 Tax=Micavibrio aeruginosavorus TaxID=349221 RepID=A0A2W5Q2B2_9BACT|nr:MAG: hypothetical protein DI551_07275 [Micavibrio aeruginosavorus]